jgi:uncharacterized integral membrane protein
MAPPYKRRKPELLRNFWVYRYLIASAFFLGVMLWFILINNTAVVVTFPFRLGKMESSAGVLILLSALAGSIITVLLMTLGIALHRLRRSRGPASGSGEDGLDELPDERPPTDYAARTTEGFTDAPWSGR